MSHVALLPFIVGTELGPGIVNGIAVDIADPEIFMVGFVCIDDRIIAVYDIPDLAGSQTLYFQTYESSPVPRLSNVIQYSSGGAQVLASSLGADTLAEGQAAGRIEVRLNEQPTLPVQIQIQNDAPDRLTIDQSVLTFTPENWQQVQSVQVAAVDDTVSRDDVTAAVRITVVDDNAQFADSLEQTLTFEVLDNDELTTPILNEAHQSFASGDVTFDWTGVEHADAYEVWIAPTLDVQNPIFRGTVESNQFESQQRLPIGKHAVWVRAKSNDGRASGWSPAGRLDVVTSTEVAHRSTDNPHRPEISWDRIPGAESYEIWVNNKSTGASRIIHRRDITSTEFIPDKDLNFGTHLVWVRGINEYGIVGRWSQAATVNLGATLRNPHQNTFERRPAFEWTPMSGAASWEIYLRVNDRVIRQSGLTEGRFIPSEDLPDGTHRWWVRGFTAQGTAGGWSEAGQITVGGRPSLLQSTFGTNSNRPNLTWSHVTDAVRYEVYLIRLDPRSLILNRTDVAQPSLQIHTDLGTGTYRFWVRAMSQNGRTSWWSQPATFEVS